MFRNTLPLFLLACGGLDATIAKNYSEDATPTEDSAHPPAPEEDSETDTEPETETDTEPEEVDEDPDEPAALEGTVGYVNFSLRQMACPECMGEPAGVVVSFISQFHYPITDSHVAWIPDSGVCIDNVVESTPSISPVDLGTSLEVHGPLHSFSVPRTSTGAYETTTLYETQYDRDSVYSVAPVGSADSFEFVSLSGFDFIEPVELLYVDPSYAFAAPIRRTGATFTWGPSGSSAEFMVIVAVYTADGSSLLGYVTCVGPDSGSLYVPGSHLSSYPRYSLAAIHLSREHIVDSPFETLGGYVETHMSWEVVGTGYID